MRNFRFLLVNWFLATFALAQGPVLPVSENALPEIIVNAEIIPDSLGNPSRIRGELSILPNGVGRDICLYAPYNDPEYGYDRGTSRRIAQFQGRTPKAVFEGGRSEFLVLSAHTREPTGPLPFVDRLLGRGVIRIKFESVIPRLPDSSPDEWFFEGFYPMLSRSCATSEYSKNFHKLVAPAHHTLNLRFPPGWTFAGPGASSGSSQVIAEATGKTLAFALLRNVTTEKLKFGNLPVTVHKRTKSFDKIIKTAEAALTHLSKMFGSYPHQSLTIAETFELQRHELPGLIAVNQPKQSVFETAQRDWLNWQHWMIATQLAMQYYGGVVTASSPDDAWLLEGIVEYSTLETLRQLPQHFNLFNTSDEGYRWLSFNYLQISELSLATLEKHAPFTQLTDKNYQTLLPFDEQHGLMYVKHAFAMRQIASFVGEKAFYGFLKNLTRQHAFQTMAPREFAAYLNQLPSPFSPLVRQQIGEFLDQWWTSDGYPDFTLEKFANTPLEDGKWISRVEVSQSGEVNFPPIVEVQDKSGRSYFVRASPTESQKSQSNQSKKTDWQVEIITNYEPDIATIDPLHESYDSNRFDNSTNWPSIQFFPGGASTLRDDGYTVIWLPYPFRRPGEPMSIGLQAALFKYANGSLFLRAEYAPQENISSLQARHRYNILNSAAYFDFLFEQSYENERLVDFSLVRSPLFNSLPQLSLIGRIRHKEQLGRRESAHESGVVGISIKPNKATNRCFHDIAGEIDHAPRHFTQGRFSYERKTISLAFGCEITPKHAVSFRLFSGNLYKEGSPPPSALFKPNDLQEARIRMDLRGVERVSKLLSLNLDLLLPFYIPIPNDTLILSRQMRFRLFSDFGHSLDQNINYSANGVGVQLPLGGDLSGAGAFSLTQLSLLSVLRSEAGDKKSKKPGILLDFSGEL